MLFFKINYLCETTKYSKYFSQNDLFVKIKYGNQSRNTTILWNNNKPIWNESFLFDYENDNKEITLELYDADVYSKNEILHTASFIPTKFSPIKDHTISIFNIAYGDIFYNTRFQNKKIALLDNRNKILENKIQQIKSILN